MVTRTRSQLVLLSMLFLFGSAGCAQLDLFGSKKYASGEMTERDLKKIPVASADRPVWEILSLWEAADGVGLDGLPSRGFAGRIMFFPFSSGGQDAPLESMQIRDGVVRILVFDDRGNDEEQSKPFHQFQFDGEVFQAFLTLSDMGGAYQVFIPYTRGDNYGSRCSLQVIYEPKDGRPVFSKRADVLLSGVSPPRKEQVVRQASHQQSDSRVVHAVAERPAVKETLPTDVRKSLPNSATISRQNPLLSEEEKAHFKSQIQALVDKSGANRQSQQ